MHHSGHEGFGAYKGYAKYPLQDALLHRRSRRFGQGLKLEGGPLYYRSAEPPQPLDQQEEAPLAFAASGITGSALSHFPYQANRQPESSGGNTMFQFVGRTVASGDALHMVALIVVNDEGVWLLKRPQDLPTLDNPGLIKAAGEGNHLEINDRARVQISEERLNVPREPPFTLGLNLWSVNQPGTSVFLPVNELTGLHINVLLTFFDHDYRYYLVDDRNDFRPAGIGRFAKSRGGHLKDNPEWVVWLQYASPRLGCRNSRALNREACFRIWA